jgi:hypothetical protein
VSAFAVCPRCAQVLPEDDARPTPQDDRATVELYDGARARGFTDAQVEYLRSCVGLAWSKAYRAGKAVRS